MLIRSRQLIEKRRLAAVLVAYQREGELCSVRERILSLFLMVSSFFTETRVFCLVLTVIRFFLCAGAFMDRCYLYLLCIRNTQGQFVPVYAHLDRISHGSKLYELYLRSRYDSHVQQMLTKGAFASDRFYYR